MSKSTNPIRVLLVDDEPEFLEATVKALRRRGFEASTAPDGPAGLAVLGKAPMDVVVLDVKMPGPDGEQVFVEIRRRWPNLPVIMLTGHGTVQQAFRTSKQGVFDYLAKPCEIEELTTLLERAAAARITADRQRAIEAALDDQAD